MRQGSGQRADVVNQIGEIVSGLSMASALISASAVLALMTLACWCWLDSRDVMSDEELR